MDLTLTNPAESFALTGHEIQNDLLMPGDGAFTRGGWADFQIGAVQRFLLLLTGVDVFGCEITRGHWVLCALGIVIGVFSAPEPCPEPGRPHALF